MKKKQLVIVGSLIIILHLVSLAQLKKEVVTGNQSTSCANVFNSFACDIPRFACWLNLAISSGSYACVKKVVETDGVTNPPTKNLPPSEIPLINAVINGNAKIVRLIYEHNSDTEIRDVNWELTPLLWVSSVTQTPPLNDSNNLQIIQFLLEKGADIDAKDKYGNTGLIATAKMGKIDYLEIFVKHKANLNLRNNNGETALMISVDDKNILNLLSSSNMLIRDLKGRTAIFYAIEKCQPNKFKLLLERKKDLLKIPDEEGVTPIEFAKRNNLLQKCPEIAEQFNH
jgi:ankyrin repeat protein